MVKNTGPFISLHCIDAKEMNQSENLGGDDCLDDKQSAVDKNRVIDAQIRYFGNIIIVLRKMRYCHIR